MGHEICSFGPSLYEPIFNAIATAAGRSGNPAAMAAEPEPEGEPASVEEGVPPEDEAKVEETEPEPAI